MPQPKSVKIAGTEIPEVQGVRLNIYTPVGPRGDYDGRTMAATVQLYRRARNTPTSEMFKSATNEDGRLNIVNGTIVLQDSRHKETYTLEMKEAYISGWQFKQPPDDDDLLETITLQVGNMTLSGGGKSKSFRVPEFNKKG
jgi:5-hydroxyisourate hydrolase-like protein (transthyretin family)